MQKKRLMRLTKDEQVAGVCAGLADYFNIDPTIVRLIFVLTAIMGGPGLVVYIALWIVMPEYKGDEMLVIEDEKVKNDERV